jgi:hypothetical protein
MNTNQDTVSTESTSVEQVDINLEEILGTPGAENVLLPDDEVKKPGMFTSTTTDLSFIDNDEEKAEEVKKQEEVLNALKEIDEEEMKRQFDEKIKQLKIKKFMESLPDKYRNVDLSVFIQRMVEKK